MTRRTLALVLALILTLCLAPSVNAEATAPITLVIAQQANTFISDYENNFFTQLLESKLGINIDFLHVARL